MIDRSDPKTQDVLQQMELFERHTGTKLLNSTRKLLMKVLGQLANGLRFPCEGKSGKGKPDKGKNKVKSNPVNVSQR